MGVLASGRRWRPTIPNQTCGHCKAVYTARSKTQRYCSNACKGGALSASRRSNWLSRKCPGCEQQFLCPPHEPTIYCSRECRLETGVWKAAADFECATCGCVFTRRFRAGGQARQFCSQKCTAEAKRTRVEAKCANCGRDFLRYPGREDTNCSKACSKEYFSGSRATWTWKGGVYWTGDRKRIRVPRPGYASKYEGEHRLIAGREIGRPVGRGEVVIHLDRDHRNNVASNLFVCGSYSEFGKRRFGSLPWPTHSNLAVYGREGYHVESAGLHPSHAPRDRDASLAEDAKRLSGEAVAARASEGGIAPC